MYKEMEEMMSSEGAYKNYRETIKAASGACVPYL